ncbi:MAG: MazG family protein, partial [Frankiales bacterium]|nr:MazG family protein [Frankiales bacterium]
MTLPDPGPAAGLARAVEIMDRLRSPGGCPWDAAQTHRSLAPYLLEEAYETLEAIETGDASHLREELGDLLLQVLFHARLAEEGPDGAEPFD